MPFAATAPPTIPLHINVSAWIKYMWINVHVHIQYAQAYILIPVIATRMLSLEGSYTIEQLSKFLQVETNSLIAFPTLCVLQVQKSSPAVSMNISRITDLILNYMLFCCELKVWYCQALWARQRYFTFYLDLKVASRTPTAHACTWPDKAGVFCHM